MDRSRAAANSTLGTSRASRPLPAAAYSMVPSANVSGSGGLDAIAHIASTAFPMMHSPGDSTSSTPIPTAHPTSAPKRPLPSTRTTSPSNYTTPTIYHSQPPPPSDGTGTAVAIRPPNERAVDFSEGEVSRREIHNICERRRRLNIRESFLALKERLPHSVDQKISKMEILRSAINHIGQLKSNLNDLEAEVNLLRQLKEQQFGPSSAPGSGSPNNVPAKGPTAGAH